MYSFCFLNCRAKQIHTKVPAVGIKHHYDPEYDNDGFDVKSRDFDNIRRFVEERSLPFFVSTLTKIMYFMTTCLALGSHNLI